MSRGSAVQLHVWKSVLPKYQLLAVSLSADPRAAEVSSAGGKSDPFSAPGREILAARVRGWVLRCSSSGMVLIFKIFSLFGISTANTHSVASLTCCSECS